MKPLRVFGLALSIVSTLLWLIEAGTGIPSEKLGRLICQERYMQPVRGITGDPSCGFNTDIYTSSGLILLFILGIFLLMRPKKRLHTSLAEEKKAS